MINPDIERLIAILQVVPTFHKRPYPAISPLRPELSQLGKTVLVTGAAEGIGLSIARNFARASVSKVIILDVNRNALFAAASQLRAEIEDASGVTIVDPRVCSVGDISESDTIWSSLSKEGILVDVLVLNAVCYGPEEPLLNSGRDAIWSSSDVNVRALFVHTQHFYKQVGHVQQKIAKDVKPEKLQVISFQLGEVLTESAKRHGYIKDTIEWYDEDLSGQFAVWTATPEAAFLHGRFVFAAWDVDDMMSEEFQEHLADPYYLKVGIKGL
ncbi:NAD(P)-binding protein [Alternaria alternata]|uniref:NAD(P)-binding protein n=1 Tax=Alternaria alternata TaxID=5599 RepID=A0A177D7X0_ALTAL|nr:NAD(P)-binding protein [Alternaria alternata]OAG15397.1 NAD(P)-binding protein [Alternaria alternata]